MECIYKFRDLNLLSTTTTTTKTKSKDIHKSYLSTIVKTYELVNTTSKHQIQLQQIIFENHK